MKTKKSTGNQDLHWRVFLALSCMALAWCFPHMAMAAPPADSCTDQPIYNALLQDRLDSVLMDIVNLVRDAINGVIQELYLGIIASPGYRGAVGAAMTLYIAFYGVSFIFGFVPPNFSQALIRVMKIGLVGSLMMPWGWFYFQDTVVRVFGTTICLPGFPVCERTAVDWLIDVMIQLGGGNPAGGHFTIMEDIMIKVFSPKMFIMIIGSLTTGPFGPIMAMALMWSVFNLFMMILRALEIYLLSMIVRALLLGMGPIFMAMMFFERTKHIFMGWINQLVSFSLQPILLFAFLAFFVSILESSVDALIMGTNDNKIELCYTKMEHMGKTMFDVQHWRFKLTDANGNSQMYEGEWTWKGPVGRNTFPFPIHIIDILVFLILAHIGTKMSTVVVEIAAEIAQASVRLTDVPNTLNGWFSGAKGGGVDMSKRMIHK